MDDLDGLSWSSEAPKSAGAQPAGRSAFDYLSKARAPTPIDGAQRVGTVSASPGLPSPPMQRPGSASAVQPGALSSNDAFSSLFETNASQPQQSLSMAERMAATGRSQPGMLSVNGRHSPATNSSPPLRSTAATAGTVANPDLWDFDLLKPTSAPSPRPTTPLSAIQSAPKLTSAPSTSLPRTTSPDSSNPPPKNFDLFADEPAPTPPGRIRLLDEGGEEPAHDQGQIRLDEPTEEDEFSIFNQPVTEPRPPSVRLAPSPAPHRPSSRSASPPPHILGQLVEMGFGIEQAGLALTATRSSDGDWDVQSAAEALMGAQEHEFERSNGGRPPASPPVRSTTSTPKQATAMEPTADLLAQASVIGQSVLKSANAYWKSGRKAVQKAVEERRQATQSSSSSGSGEPSRPKWMQSAEEFGEQGHTDAEVAAFRDEADVARPRPVEPRDPKPARQQEASRPRETPPETRSYRSAYRHGAPTRTQTSEPPSLATQASRATRAPTKPPRPKVSATPAQVAASDNYRQRGNDFFKLGRFGDAESAYTTAMDSLPHGHDLILALLTNRASSRLKTGDEAGAVKDCTLAIESGASSELLGKALSRRAKGYEALEKWKEALADWSLVRAEGDTVTRGAGGLRVISEGVARCRMVLEPPPKTKPTSKVVRPNPPAPSYGNGFNEGPSDAVLALRQASEAAEIQDAQMLSIKDDIDAKLLAWKGGKETNLRALIASLDSILWPELGWKRVGMHELVTDGQVKVRYVRAISKVHPDKLGPQTSAENRMVANGVFAALSDAFAAHRGC